MSTARLIITDGCIRGCEHCHSKLDGIKKATYIYSIAPLKDHEAVCLIGGEPMEDPKRTLQIIELIKLIHPTIKIYLYSSRYSVEMITIIDKIDGLTFDIQETAGPAELLGFNKMQIIAGRFPNKSFRLRLNPWAKIRVPVKPLIWDSISTLQVLTNKTFELPSGESLYHLKMTP